MLCFLFSFLKIEVYPEGAQGESEINTNNLTSHISWQESCSTHSIQLKKIKSVKFD
jgi:hypothetical protein